MCRGLPLPMLEARESTQGLHGRQASGRRPRAARHLPGLQRFRVKQRRTHMAGLPPSPDSSGDAGGGRDRGPTIIDPGTFRDGATDGASAEPLIRLRGVTKDYETGSGPFTALQDVDLSVRSGVFVAIVGRSGSGKSTLVNVITGIDRPTAGEVRVAGARVDALSQRQLALWRGRNVGVVFQFFQLLPGLTVAENVVLPMEFCGTYAVGDRLPRALKLLDRVGIR